MKFFFAITLIAAVASAAVVRPLRSEIDEIQEIIAAIQSPSTDPATAAALEQMLLDIMGIKPEPVAVGPAIVNPIEGISVGPALVEDFDPSLVGPAINDIALPVEEVEAVAEEPAIVPTPVAVVEGVSTEVASGTPLVQIILNINQAAAESSPIAVGPAVTPEHVEEVIPTPVHIVEVAPTPVHIVEVAPEPVQVVEVAPEPVHVVEVAPEPVQIGAPIIPEAAVVLPEELN